MSTAYTVAFAASAGRANRQEKEYPSNPCNMINGGPEPLRAPSQPPADPKKEHVTNGMEATTRDELLTTNQAGPIQRTV